MWGLPRLPRPPRRVHRRRHLDQTTYLEQTLSGPARTRWLSDERLSAYRALQERLTSGFDDDDVLALGLPDDADLDGALQLIRDGLRELAAVHVS